MRILLIVAFMLSITFNSLYAQDKTSQLGIGVYDLIYKNTNFIDVKCESYKCNFVSDDNITTMEMKRVDFDLFLKRDINIMLDINVNSSLFNCKEEGPCKSGLVVHYHNDPDLIRVYIKNSKDSIEATTKEEIKILQSWLKRAIKIAASS
tara:strand:- start:301 stop:750 length:450 start_codon:yes stop_codon:yes gene_type:complete